MLTNLPMPNGIFWIEFAMIDQCIASISLSSIAMLLNLTEITVKLKHIEKKRPTLIALSMLLKLSGIHGAIKQ